MSPDVAGDKSDCKEGDKSDCKEVNGRDGSYYTNAII